MSTLRQLSQAGVCPSTPREGRRQAQDHCEPARAVPPARGRTSSPTLLCLWLPAAHRDVLGKFFCNENWLLTHLGFPLNQLTLSLTWCSQFSFDFHPVTQDLGSWWGGLIEGLPTSLLRLPLASGGAALQPQPWPSDVWWVAKPLPVDDSPFCWCCQLQVLPSPLVLHIGEKLLDKYHP